MLNLARTHDYQINLSPSQAYPAVVNPPSFNWPNNIKTHNYTLELKSISGTDEWCWKQVCSPFQMTVVLPHGHYKWRLLADDDAQSEHISEWIEFHITEEQVNYIAPTAQMLFEQCDGHNQWLMYLDEDISTIRKHSLDTYLKLKNTALLSAPLSEIQYPNHYQRGQEEGKREAIANARNWIDRDLMCHTLLYRIWGEQEHGRQALDRLLKLAEWSPEGPASLLRPCTWGDEVGCSLARNLFLAYHWLSPLLKDSEKNFVRPMLIRIAQQIKERLSQDEFEQYPGHSHTSRLPSYLGIAALALYREHDKNECSTWLSYALMTYRGILPFYGGRDGSWAEGPFYASTYSKWYHPFFLSVERLSDFSFYQHPFYQNFLTFARDFIAPNQRIHPFGDGFWCQREGKEWPGFFSQNPLRIYAARFGDQTDYQQSQNLEKIITDYRLHLLDVIPTIKQIEFNLIAQNKKPSEKKLDELQALRHYYAHAGLGKLTQKQMALYFRASAFGNSSHRHGDQGNIALFDNDIEILIPTGSYGYRFGSKHHSEWTRQTIAHNLPLVDQQGQNLDDQNSVARIVQSYSESNYHLVTLDLSDSYAPPLEHFHRTIVLLEAYGLFIVDSIFLNEEKELNWRLHSPLHATLNSSQETVLLTQKNEKNVLSYKCGILNHAHIQATLTHGYADELSIPDRAIESDASKDITHLDWHLKASNKHQVIACCIKENLPFPTIRFVKHNSENIVSIELTIEENIITLPTQ